MVCRTSPMGMGTTLGRADPTLDGSGKFTTSLRPSAALRSDCCSVGLFSINDNNAVASRVAEPARAAELGKLNAAAGTLPCARPASDGICPVWSACSQEANGALACEPGAVGNGAVAAGAVPGVDMPCDEVAGEDAASVGAAAAPDVTGAAAGIPDGAVADATGDGVGPVCAVATGAKFCQPIG